jgi:adenylate cyclase
LLQAEIELAAQRPSDLTAYDFYLRATPRSYAMTREDNAEALRLLDRALEIDPRYGAAASLANFCRTINLLLGWTVDPEFEISEVTRLSQLILSIDENDPDTLANVGWARAYVARDFDAATEMVDRAVALNPNSTIAWNYRGITYQYQGHPKEALRSFEHALRLSPIDPMLYATIAMMGLAFIGLHRFAEAEAAARKALSKNRTFMPAHRCLVSALALQGRDDEARAAASRLLELEPGYRISDWIIRSRQWRAGLLVEGLRRAGLPE